MYNRNNHFLKRNPPMLESILEVIHVVIVIIGVSKEIIFHSKDIGRGYIQSRKLSILGSPYLKNFPRLKIQILSLLVPQVCRDMLISNNLVRPIYPLGPVICRQNHLPSCLLDFFHQLK